MASITIRNIPDEIMERIKTLSITEKRSINNELVYLLEKSVKNYCICSRISEEGDISKETQLSIWKDIAGKWKDSRSTKEIIRDIYKNRTLGREIDL